MKLQKGLKALIPTVQYGNVTIELSLDDEVEKGKTAQETAINIRKAGQLLDQMLCLEYQKVHEELESVYDELSSINKKED